MADKVRCGIIVFNSLGEILIEHPFGYSKTKTHCWDIPKGHWDSSLDLKTIDVAIRECKEETGLSLEKNEVNHIITIDYNRDTLHIFGVNHPIEIDMNELHCDSKIENCSQEWKNGKPEVDDYLFVAADEITDFLFKGYNQKFFKDAVYNWVSDHL